MTSDPPEDHDSEEELPHLHIEGSDELLADALKSVEVKDTPEKTKGANKPEPINMDQIKSMMEKKDAIIKEGHDRLLRLQADNENYKKRMKKDRDIAIERARADLILEILPLMDSFHRTVETTKEGAQDVSSVIEGVNLVHKQALSILEKLRVIPMETEGKPFDPKFHEALSKEPHDSVPHMHITQELERGYLIGEKLLRAAKVVVAENPEPSQDSPNTDDESDSDKGGDVHKIKC